MAKRQSSLLAAIVPMLFLAQGAVAQAPSAVQKPLGPAPTVVNRILSDVPNAQAITSRAWVPDLDTGFVPQGLAWQGRRVVLSGYISTDTSQSRGPCRVIWLSPTSGRVAGRASLPATCGHAGGVAAISGGRLVIADTRMLFVMSGGRVSASIKLSGNLRGSFADFDGKDLWIGSYDRGGGQLWRIPISALAKPEISEADALETLPAPSGAQGLAFDRRGGMWATTSGSRSGAVIRLDRRTGAVLASYDAPVGIEDVAFDGQGRLWASSEAGSRRWSNWSTFYPLVFSIDVSKLK